MRNNDFQKYKEYEYSASGTPDLSSGGCLLVLVAIPAIVVWFCMFCSSPIIAIIVLIVVMGIFG